MRVTIVRHGQTEENFLNKIQGQRNVLMNDTGRRQCERLRVKIKDKNYDYCYMSPMTRTVETAFILIGDRVETIPDNRLKERFMGELEGKSREMYNAYKFWDYDLNKSDFDVEPIHDVFKRCIDFFDYIKKKHKDQSILVVTHGSPYRALRHLLLNHEIKGNLFDGGIDNCQCEEFEV